MILSACTFKKEYRLKIFDYYFADFRQRKEVINDSRNQRKRTNTDNSTSSYATRPLIRTRAWVFTSPLPVFLF